MAPRRRKGKKNPVHCGIMDHFRELEMGRKAIAEGQPNIIVRQCFNRNEQSAEEQGASGMGLHMCRQDFESKEEMESLAAIRDPLCLALQKGNVEISKLLIKAGRNVNYLTDTRTPMSYALDSAECSKEIVQVVFDAGFPKDGIVNSASLETTLHVAASKNFVDVVKYLLSISVDVNAKDVNGRTPLHTAVRRNNPVIVELLVKHGAQINCECSDNFTPLFYAIITGNCDMVKLLIKLGANLNQLSKNPKCNLMPLHLGAFLGQENVVQAMLDNGVDVNRPLPSTGEIALHFVIRAEVLNDEPKDEGGIVSMNSMAELLVMSGSDLKAKQLEGYTPLQMALKSKKFTLARYLIECGSDLNDQIDLQGISEAGKFTTTFHLIAKTLDRNLIKTSLEYGADWRLQDGLGRYPGQVALESYIEGEKKMACKTLFEIVIFHQEKMSILRLFWRYGFPYDLTTIRGSDSQIPVVIRTMLRKQTMWFSSLKHLNKGLMNKALNECALANCCNTKLFKFPLHTVVVMHCEEIYETLLKGGLPVNSLDSKGQTPLQVAARIGTYEVCVLLLQYGAAYNACSAKCPKTPYQLALQYNRSEEITCLLKSVDECFKTLKCTRLKKSEPPKSFSGKKFRAIMNCTGKDGLSLIGRALKLGLKKKAQTLMKLKLKHELN